jgi:AI-2 transport protein TqsA
LAFALFLIALAWPIQKWLQRYLPRLLAFSLALLSLLLVFAIFVGLLVLSANIVMDKAPEYSDEWQRMYGDAQSWAQARGISLPGSSSGANQGQSSGSSGLGTILRQGLSTVGLWILVFGFLVLGLHEVPLFRNKIAHGRAPQLNPGLLEVADEIARKFHIYFLTRTAVSLIQGVTAWLFTWMVGLDLAFVWGLTSALLNYIPTIGSLIAVVPPGLFALFQFQDPGKAALVFAGLCAIQLGLGTFVDPLLEGRQLQVSPLVVLFSIAFWGWVWGIAGALLGVPLTVGIAIVCQQFESTKWITELLTHDPKSAEDEPDKSNNDASDAA